MSLKAQIGRRIFAKALPAAPLAAAEMGRNMIGSGIPSLAMPKCGTNTAPSPAPEDVAWKEKRKKLDAARHFLYNEGGMHEWRHRERFHGFININPNIVALRSVSDQHKIHMHIKHEDAMASERKSFQEKILRMFGLGEDKSARYDLF